MVEILADYCNILLFILPKCAIICHILALGGKAMKRIISLLLVTVICAGVLAGCGGGQSTTSSSISSQNSVISKYLPHSENLTWDSTKSSVPNAYETDVSIGSIVFDSPDYDFDSSDKIKNITYKKRNITSGYYNFIVKTLNKLYGKNEETENAATWKVKIPTGENCLISLSDNTDEKKEVVLSYDIQRKTNTQTSSTTSSKTTDSKSDTSSKSSSSTASSRTEVSSTPVESKASSSTPTVTTSQRNALRRAKQYLDIMPFSYTGLIEQLEFEKHSHEDAVYAADNCGADWNKQAAKKAKEYLDIMAFSRDGLIEQLEFEGYTHEQAVYGVDQTGL